MLSLLKRRVDAAGAVAFRGNLQPRPEEFESLASRGIRIRQRSPGNAIWALDLDHAEWGEATLMAHRDATPPLDLVDFEIGLSDAERLEARSAGTILNVHLAGTREDVMLDRKRLLWYLRQVMGDEGVIAVDHHSLRLWSRAALDDELSHDAMLDIESLYTMHSVFQGEEDNPSSVWLHTHGLAHVGAFDLDVLNPDDAMAGDPMRCLAWLAIEGDAAIGADLTFANPGGVVRLVDAREFMRKARPEHASIRDDDEFHNTDRAVLCEPAGMLSRLRGNRPEPSRFCSSDMLDQCVYRFSVAVTELMAARARGTLALFRDMSEEFAEFQVMPLVKLGVPTASGDHEHIWFHVHAFEDDAVDATCINRPFDVPGLHEGDRARHTLEHLTDWTISAPFGQITPRQLGIARRIREAAPQLRRMMAEFGDRGGTDDPDA